MIDVDVKVDLDLSAGQKEVHYVLHVDVGEFITLFGQSGAGKTTLLRILAGLMKPKSGSVIVDGEVWFDSAKKINLPPQQRSIGFMFQEYALFPFMSVRENLLYADKNANIDELLEITELVSLADKKPESLSGGQKQRVALARALARNPKILLLDEPLSALDYSMRAKLQGELMTIHNKFHITTIMVSHDIHETMRLSDRVAMIEDGSIIKYDTPINIFGDSNGLYGEVIFREGNSLTLLVGSSIVSMSVDDGSQHKTGDRIKLNITA